MNHSFVLDLLAHCLFFLPHEGFTVLASRTFAAHQFEIVVLDNFLLSFKTFGKHIEAVKAYSKVMRNLKDGREVCFGHIVQINMSLCEIILHFRLHNMARHI